MQQKGYVTKADSDIAKVIVVRESACGHSCDSCGGGCSSPNISLNIENKLGAKTGDYVLIESKSSTILKSAFVAYIVPLILLIVGVSIGMKLFNNMGYENYETLAFLMGLVFVVISYFLLKFVDNKYFRDNDSLLEMVEVLEK